MSIILPVYNVEDYLGRCLRSLLDQDIPLEEYEIIAVNDGSPDNSREVILRMMKESANIILIDQQNKGVSMARNAGMDRARGKYLLFIDPDDYVLPQTLRKVIELADMKEAQVTFLGYRLLDAKGCDVAEVLNLEHSNKVYRGVEAYPLSRGNGRLDPDRSWGILFERRFIDMNGVRFVADIPYLEDGELIARVLCLADRCLFSGRSFYIRTTRAGSATNSDLFFRGRSIDGFILAAKSLASFQEKLQLTESHRIFLNQPICKFVLLVLIPSCSFRNLSRFRASAKRLRDMGLGKCSLNGCILYYRIEGWLYNIHPLLFFIHRVLRMPLFWPIPEKVLLKKKTE